MVPNLSDRNLLILGAALCAIAAWFTIGYHNPDEHTQIWEFAHYKLGQVPASDLSWEFAARMRPGLQPFLAYGLIITAKAAGILSPFTQGFLARLICGAIALWVYWNWTQWLERDLKNPTSLRWLRYGLLFFWLMPYLNVRFTSENTAALSFFGGLLLLLQAMAQEKNKLDWRFCAAGMLLGLSFFFRYQIAFAGIGLGAWLLLRNRLSWKAWIALSAGLLLAFGIGFGTDYWLYQEWVFAPYNYYFSNIVERKAAGFGVMPAWWYATEMPIALVPPLSIILMVFFGLGVWQKPWHPMTWCVVPFIVAHSMVAHKEVRFLYPMALPFFFLAVVGWEYFRARFLVKNWMRVLFRCCLWLNALLLLFRIFIPAKEIAAYYKFIWNWQIKHPDSSVYFVKPTPQKHFPLVLSFYEHPMQRQYDWYTQQGYKNDTTALHPGDLMVFTEARISPPPVAPPGFRIKAAYKYYPDWILGFDLNNWQSRTLIWEIYSLELAQ